jgi:hypothetical protein
MPRVDTLTGMTQYGSYLHGKQTSLNGAAMKTSSDKMYEKYKDFDFADAKSVSDMAVFRSKSKGKSLLFTLFQSFTPLIVFSININFVFSLQSTSYQV